MQFTNLIVIHCSATCCDHSYTEYGLTTNHLRRGFSGADYHSYIHKNRDTKILRPIGQLGVHVKNHNAHSADICYEGGLDERGHPADIHTDLQKHSLRVLVMLLLRDYPSSRPCGHCDLSPDFDCDGETEPEEWIKACPCFDAASILQDSAPPSPAYL